MNVGWLWTRPVPLPGGDPRPGNTPIENAAAWALMRVVGPVFLAAVVVAGLLTDRRDCPGVVKE